MAKREFAHPNELPKYVGQEIGVSDWVEVSQDRINRFADATGDHQWIHVDVERAKKEMPGGKTIAHGFLTLSLIPMLNHQISHINNVKRGINYGCNKVRFTSPVPAGSKVRATWTPTSNSRFGTLFRYTMMLWPSVCRSLWRRNAQTPSSIGFHREANSSQLFATPRDTAVGRAVAVTISTV